LYFVPLIYVFLARTLSPLGICKTLLVLLVIPSAVVNVGLRNGIAVAERQRRDYREYSKELVRLIPPEAVTVGGWNHYYIGLRQNWKMFPYDYLNGIDRPPEAFYLLIAGKDDIPEGLAPFHPQYLGTTEVAGPQFSSWLAASYTTRVYHCRAAPP
jgi:hypothetical protein